MGNFLLIAQLLLSLAIIFFIILQVRGGGLSRGILGGSQSFARRGVEKLIFKLTFVFVALFAIVSVLRIFL
ncbi:MAG: preprotein translocase subunit SecG [Patescibacteria group bacterium]